MGFIYSRGNSVEKAPFPESLHFSFSIGSRSISFVFISPWVVFRHVCLQGFMCHYIFLKKGQKMHCNRGHLSFSLGHDSVSYWNPSRKVPHFQYCPRLFVEVLPSMYFIYSNFMSSERSFCTKEDTNNHLSHYVCPPHMQVNEIQATVQCFHGL